MLKSQSLPAPAHFLCGTWHTSLTPLSSHFFMCKMGPIAHPLQGLGSAILCSSILHPSRAHCAALGRSSDDHYITSGPSGFRRAMLTL